MPRLPKWVRRHRDKYRAVLSVDGVAVRSPVFDTPEEAHDWAALRKRCRPGKRVLTLLEGYEHLVAHLTSTGARQGTLDHYAKYWAVITRPGGWGVDSPLHRISREQVTRYVARRVETGVSLETVWTKEVQLVERILNQAFADDLMPTKPLEKLRKPRMRHKRFAYIPADTVRNIVAAIRGWSGRGMRNLERDADVIAWAFGTGMRRGEMARCTDRDIDLRQRTIFVDGKNDNRHLPLTDELAAIARRAILRAGAGRPLFGGSRTIENVFLRWRQRLEDPRLAPHVMRHSFATEMVRQGVHLLDLMTLLGHKTPSQTARYFHAANTPALHAAMARLSLTDSGHRDLPSEGSAVHGRS